MEIKVLEDSNWEIREPDGSIRSELTVAAIKELWDKQDLSGEAQVRLQGTDRWLALFEVEMFKELIPDQKMKKRAALTDGWVQVPYLIVVSFFGGVSLACLTETEHIPFDEEARQRIRGVYFFIGGIFIVAFLMGIWSQTFQLQVWRSVKPTIWLLNREMRRVFSMLSLGLFFASIMVLLFLFGSTTEEDGTEIEGAFTLLWFAKSLFFVLVGTVFWVSYSVLKKPPTFRVAAPQDWVPKGVQLRESRFRSQILAKLLRITPLALLLATLPGVAYFVRSSLGGRDPIFVFWAVLGTCLFAGLLWIQMRALSSRLESGSPLFLLRSDPRPPIVYLRNFRSDDQRFGILGTIGSEVMLTELFYRNVGPLVAIGKPGELIPSLGADRIYIESPNWDGWKDVVAKLIDECGAVVFSAELHPSSQNDEVEVPEGLKWEINRALDHTPDRIALVVGRKDFSESYSHFREAFSPLVEEKTGWPLPEKVYRDSIILIQNGQPEILRNRYCLRTMVGHVLGLSAKSVLIWEQLFSQAQWTGYKAGRCQRKKAIKSGKLLLMALILSIPMALPFPREVNIWLWGLMFFGFFCLRFHWTLIQNGLPCLQWKPEQDIGVQANMIRHVKLLRFFGIIVLAGVSLILVWLARSYLNAVLSPQ